MAKSTKISRKELYKSDYESISDIVDDIKASYRIKTTTRLSRDDLKRMKTIHDKFYSQDPAKLSGCGNCIMKLIQRVNLLITNYENGLK